MFRYKNYTAENPILLNELMRMAPSAFTTEKGESRGDNYGHINTAQCVDVLTDHGWVPVKATEGSSRDENNQGYMKHMIRFQNSVYNRAIAGDSNPEIVLVNSHNGKSSLQMKLGVFRLICSNGLVVGDTWGDVRIPHIKLTQEEVHSGLLQIAGSVPKIAEVSQGMKELELSPQQQQEFGALALEAKYPTEKNDGFKPLTPEQVVRSRRRDDNGSDLWTTFNVAQENLVRGGIRGLNKKGRVARVREVKGIDSNIKLNQMLWELAEKYKAIVS